LYRGLISRENLIMLYYNRKTFFQNTQLNLIATYVIFLLGGVFIGLTLYNFSFAISMLFILGPIIIIAFFFRPEYSIYAYFFIIILMTEYFPTGEQPSGIFIFRETDTLEGLPPPTIIYLLLMFLLLISRNFFISGKKSIVSTKYIYFFFVVLLISAANGYQNGCNPIEIRVDFMQFLFPIICFFLCVNILNNKSKISQAIFVVYIACLVKSLILSIYYILGHGVALQDEEVIRVTTYDPSDLLAFVTMIILVITQIMKQRNFTKKSFILMISAIPMLFVIIFSYRRAIWMGTLSSLGLLFLLGSELTKKKIIISTFFIFLFLILFLNLFLITNFFIPQGNFSNVFNRVSTIFDPEQSSNKHHYLETVQTLKEIIESPLLGSGLGSHHMPVSLIDWDADKQPTGIVHNTWLYIWMKTGMLGLLFYIFIGIKYLNKILKYKKVRNEDISVIVLAIASTLAFWYTLSLVSPILAFYHRSFLIAFFMAIVISRLKTENNEPIQKVQF